MSADTALALSIVALLMTFATMLISAAGYLALASEMRRAREMDALMMRLDMIELSLRSRE